MQNWDESCNIAFKSLKKALITAPILVSPQWNKPFICHTDASQYAVGGTLTQKDQDYRDRVVAYFSKRITKTEENYSANDRELLALVYFLKRFRCYLEGSTFTVETDNQLLRHFFTKKDISRREARWLDFLSSFGINEVVHKAGKIHVLGYALSRIPLPPSTPETNNIEVLAVEPPSDLEGNYSKDATFGPIVAALRGLWPECRTQ